ncbi:hypothetical protein B0T19DRAFT_473749 [Cercophora scortea]|uniref:Uncharacterized protein n=1 Tax=Cercophora scortea TaxID=314031 RepID=A0AAE0IYQ3_9PEZI|nr:hypothetical protein B0T19DRAFT_473749 [Cercophora scortea]
MSSEPYQSFSGSGAYRPPNQESYASDSLPPLPSNYNAASDQYYTPSQTDNNGSNATSRLTEDQQPSYLPPVPTNYNAAADQYNNTSTHNPGPRTSQENPNMSSTAARANANTPDNTHASHEKPTGEPDQDRDNSDSESEKKKRIGGLSPRAIFIILIVLAATIAISVGVGVGVSQSKKKSSKKSSSSSSGGGSGGSGGGGTKTTTKYTPTIIATRTTTSSTRTPTPTAIFLNNQTFPAGKMAFQAFSEGEYLGKATGVMQKTGFYDLGLDCKSFVWLESTACCVTLCANRTTAVGVVCDERFERRLTVTAAGVKSFPRVHLWCASESLVSQDQEFRD